jgi:hypothetical protein
MPPCRLTQLFGDGTAQVRWFSGVCSCLLLALSFAGSASRECSHRRVVLYVECSGFSRISPGYVLAAAVVGVKVASRGYRLAAAPPSPLLLMVPPLHFWRVLLCPMCVA